MIACDTMWQALSALLIRPDLADLTAPQRRDRQDALESLIATWTADQTPDAAMGTLQSQGIAAGVVGTPVDLTNDPHLIVRGFWHRLDRSFIGMHLQSFAAFREGPNPYPVRRVAPTLGQDNEAILAGRLHLTREEIDHLAAAGLIGTVPQPRRAQSDQ